MLIRFDTIHERTDGRTDTQTDGHRMTACAMHSIARQKSR